MHEVAARRLRHMGLWRDNELVRNAMSYSCGDSCSKAAIGTNVWLHNRIKACVSLTRTQVAGIRLWVRMREETPV